MTIINSVFDFKVGDIIQIFENNCWGILGHIKDPKIAAIDFQRNNFTILGKPVRIIRRT